MTRPAQSPPSDVEFVFEVVLKVLDPLVDELAEVLVVAETLVYIMTVSFANVLLMCLSPLL